MSQIDRRAFLAAAGAAAAVPLSARAQEPGGGWVSKASLPWAVQEIYCAVSNGRIVTAGGLRRPARVTEIEDRTGVYDPATDAWSEGPRLPSPRHHPMVVTCGGALMFVGGYGRSDAGDWTAMTDAWMADGEAMTAVAPLPTPLSESVGVDLGGRAHLVTGRRPLGAANGQWNDQSDVANHWAYDRDADRWEVLRPAPMARNSAAGAVLDGALWVAGGRTVTGGGTGRLDRYDPAADRWDTLAPIPPSPATGQQVGGGLAMAAVGGKLVAFGGEWFAPGGGGVFAETWIYELAADRWDAGPPMRTPRHGLAAAAVDGVVYAIAGGEVVSGGRAGGVVEACEFRV
ncbi:MAG: kelch repeat-containing protein [Brevundimonas sp.]|uniref:Kelch repeat-containing protein n=1 Tax=Brevundimonas sp. TaxID=1871086 RepID=UPI002718D368|nr:kelch repeat-containing protein [Brevundimonas sp.]MDO9078638.1 kelch repeat-containing protein [Brevundimonas sp.]MDP3080895.1 kelch repeat-containing protein [Brevundimonas sp.]MDZ4060762.1 kelch repeat-containing protein [Brevundimonas sp.]